MTRLAAQDLHIAIGDKVLCRNLNLRLEAGENWAILGANGSGKTSVLHSLAGLRPIHSGQILLDGQDLNSWSTRAQARVRGVLFQDSEGVFPATALETVLSGRYPYHSPWRWENAEDKAFALAALAAVELSGYSTRTLNTLSGGERRRVEIAALLAQDAPLCFLDEPTNHLDQRYQTQLLALLSKRAQRPGHLNVMVLHDVNLAVRFCSHALLMFPNGDHQTGPIGSLLNKETLARLYECTFQVIETGTQPVYLPI